jgi:hypothetical protein
MSLHQQHLEIRLAPIREELGREFPTVPPSEIEASFLIVVKQLRVSARILDYVPVLALRLTRERLQARRDAAPDARAA